MVLDVENAGVKSSLIQSSYFLVLDTNIILDQVNIILNHSVKHLFTFFIGLYKQFDNYR